MAEIAALIDAGELRLDISCAGDGVAADRGRLRVVERSGLREDGGIDVELAYVVPRRRGRQAAEELRGRVELGREPQVGHPCGVVDDAGIVIDEPSGEELRVAHGQTGLRAPTRFPAADAMRRARG